MEGHNYFPHYPLTMSLCNSSYQEGESILPLLEFGLAVYLIFSIKSDELTLCQFYA